MALSAPHSWGLDLCGVVLYGSTRWDFAPRTREPPVPCSVIPGRQGPATHQGRVPGLDRHVR
jgi:hypothetical protein